MNFDLRLGDSLDVLRGIADASVDALVTDPPAGISFMGKAWDGRAAFREQMRPIFAECLRVLKPGAHGLVWALPRTSHWTATALEDAGFEIRDRVSHLFGTGFPKSLDVSKAIDKAAGAEREVVATIKKTPSAASENLNPGWARPWAQGVTTMDITTPATLLAQQWEGWGTALKPACEDWWLVRRPLDGTVAANVLAHGTGALNVDGCRIGTEPAFEDRPGQRSSGGILNNVGGIRVTSGGAGRWPANVTLDEEAAALLDEQSGETGAAGQVMRQSGTAADAKFVFGGVEKPLPFYADTGGASRFFYVAKPDRAERDIGCEDLPAASGGEATARADGTAGLQNPRAGAGRNGGARNIHPTVKSVDLMRWLCRLVTPRGGMVLDPFMGSGSTGVACSREGFRFLGIERERAYFEIAKRRLVGDAPLLNRLAT